ncbi:MAG: PEP-CTERM sorting domain-containing protein [Deltaproteobacteria bacterium]|nr:PEP-CTERM sorting domain-containing protein [Deltaproteobacteria bacterium]
MKLAKFFRYDERSQPRDRMPLFGETVDTLEGVVERFVDTSAYFIEILLMDEAGIDTDYNPDLTPLPEPSRSLMLFASVSLLAVLSRRRPR